MGRCFEKDGNLYQEECTKDERNETKYNNLFYNHFYNYINLLNLYININIYDMVHLQNTFYVSFILLIIVFRINFICILKY